MDEYNSTHIALIQENLLKIRIKSLKMSKIVIPLKIAKHYKLIRKIHLAHRMKLPISKEAIYWATLENETDQRSIDAFGDCMNEDLPFITNVEFHLKSNSKYSVLSFKQMFVECSIISVEFYRTSVLVNLLIYEDQLSYFQMDQAYSVSKISICHSLELVVWTERNYELRSCQSQLFDSSESSEQEKHIKNQYNSSMAITSDRSDRAIVSAYESPLTLRNESIVHSTISNLLTDHNNHKSFKSDIHKSWQRNPLVVIECILDKSIIPHSWISLFQFSDFYLELVIVSLLEEIITKFNVKKPQSVKSAQVVSQLDNFLVTSSVKLIGRRVSDTFVTNSIINLTIPRWIQSNVTRSDKLDMVNTKDIITKRSSANNNSDLKGKTSAVQSALMRREHQMPAAMIRHYYNADLRDHKRFVPLCSSMYLRQQMKMASTSKHYTKKGRLERITIKGATDKVCRIADEEIRLDLFNRNSFDLGFMTRLH